MLAQRRIGDRLPRLGERVARRHGENRLELAQTADAKVAPRRCVAGRTDRKVCTRVEECIPRTAQDFVQQTQPRVLAVPSAVAIETIEKRVERLERNDGVDGDAQLRLPPGRDSSNPVLELACRL